MDHVQRRSLEPRGHDGDTDRERRLNLTFGLGCFSTERKMGHDFAVGINVLDFSGSIQNYRLPNLLFD